MIDSRIPVGLPSLEEAAELTWTSTRTLARRLAEEGTSWRVMVDDIKFAHAVSRLQVAGTTVAEIADELGYSDPAHFTRFFSRRANLSPSQYRYEIERARALAQRETRLGGAEDATH